MGKRVVEKKQKDSLVSNASTMDYRQFAEFRIVATPDIVRKADILIR